ncbi:MAG: hypothetical protein HKP61_08485 [Dactylosporangium sp.]|nr:hypothetical protein [Dactylosporangium sp.]NNJ60973.1 hypothetical protein [Dactylosporangium sp.]
MMPTTFGAEGSDGFISQPLAIVVVGGLLGSTALVLVPILYTMAESRDERLLGGGARRDSGHQREALRPAL